MGFEDAGRYAANAAKVKAEEDAKKAAAAKAAADQAEKERKAKMLEDIQKRYEGYTPKKIETVAGAGPIEMQETLAKRKSALAGYSAPELAGMQAQVAAGQQAAQQQRERALQSALAQRNIQGGTAAALQAQMAQKAYQEKALMDQEMMMKQVERQRQALGEYERSVGGSLQTEQQKQFQELSARLAAEQAYQAQLALESQQKEAEIYAKGQKEAAQQGKVICTELYNQGLMDRLVYEADQDFGKLQDYDVMLGYYTWAQYVVRWMKASSIVTNIVYCIATPWSQEMAFRMGGKSKPNFIGKILMTVGIPTCRIIGKYKAKRLIHAK